MWYLALCLFAAGMLLLFNLLLKRIKDLEAWSNRLSEAIQDVCDSDCYE